MSRFWQKPVRHEINISGHLPPESVKGLCRMLRRAVRMALTTEGITEPCRVDILLTDDAHIHAINREQRGVDRHTDVLSFPMNELMPEAFASTGCERDPATGRIFLGDMVIDVAQCRRQAAELGHSPEREISYLAVHSVLHLLGYDHMDEGEEKRRMRAHEESVMDRLGLSREGNTD
ncbi:MAG: rRNA maturation RNase YbeY [Oscillospiraceae bacterium]|nr:rRNA maturation RNase YbeY [Oscillospiraceae bacterium]